jgi:hypothetical protein
MRQLGIAGGWWGQNIKAADMERGRVLRIEFKWLRISNKAPAVVKGTDVFNQLRDREFLKHKCAHAVVNKNRQCN